MGSLPKDAGARPLAVLAQFWRDFHQCLTARADELCELADAVLCTDGPVKTLAALSLAPEHQRGHGVLYDAVNHVDGRAKGQAQMILGWPYSVIAALEPGPPWLLDPRQ